jgi:selenium metabolism protein YedF
MDFIINGETMGRGDENLGAKLMANFFRTLVGLEQKPDALIFYNAAVKMLGPDSPHLDALRALDEAGVDLLACVTCLEFYDLTQSLAVGCVSTMREISQRLISAKNTVTI